MVNKAIINLDSKQFPFLKILIAYILGIICADQTIASFPQIFIIECGLLVLLAFYFLTFYLSQLEVAKRLSTLFLYLLFLLFGYYQFLENEPSVQNDHFSKYPAIQYAALVLDEPVEKEKSIRFPVEIQSAIDSSNGRQAVGRVMVTLLKDSNSLLKPEYGDIIVFRNKISPVKPAFNPVQFDYKSFLESKSIWHQLLAVPDDVRIIKKEKGNSLLSYSFKLRQRLVDKFRTYIEDDRSFQIASALIFGYRSSMDQEVLHSFLKTGTIHVLSVSGLHVTIVFVLLNFLLKWVDRFRFGRILRYSFVLMLIWSYVVLTGMAAPVLRSGLMITFFIAGEWMNRKQSFFNALATSAFILLLFSPRMLFEIGFQLSYLAMIGLGTFLVLLQKWYTPENKWGEYAINTAYVSISAQLTTLPLIISYFGQFPNYFLIANFFIAIPSVLMMYVGIALALVPWHSGAYMLGVLLNYIIKLTFDGLTWIAYLPFSSMYLHHDGIWPAIILFLCIIFLFYAFNNRNKNVLFGCCIFMLMYSLFIQYGEIKKYNFDGIKIYNVNQHLAIARIVNNKVVLFSSLDSINHSVLVYNVLPDVSLHQPINEVRFEHMDLQNRKNYKIHVDGIAISILEGYVENKSNSTSDIVFIRKNNRVDVQEIVNQNSKSIIVMDGSNSDYYIKTSYESLGENKGRIYSLKNNYAYVWNKVNNE